MGRTSFIGTDHCRCQKGHVLPVKYWGEACPICMLVYRAEIAIEDGEWALLESRNKLQKAVDEVKRMYE
jgi:hypothetical protein